MKTKEVTITVIRDDKPTPMQVRVAYCTATETGFERIAEKSINDISFQSSDDMLKLSLAAITAAYARDEQDPPVTSADLLYDVSPKEIIALLTAVIQLRAEWYGIPKVMAEDEQPATDEQQKNA